jgi:rubrerythrin
MKNTFSLSEVFRMAEEIERNGYQFYQEAAQATKNPDVKKVLANLAEKEKKHEELFADLRKEQCTASDMHLVDPDGEVELYIRSMAYGHVFNLDKDISELLTSIQSPRSILQLAITFEKDTIVFFTALKRAVTDINKDKVDRLIQEEISHIHELQDTLKNC